MNIIKSLFVLLCLLALLVFTLALFVECVQKARRQALKKSHAFKLLLFVIITAICMLLFGDYAYPFERTLEPVLIAEFDVPAGYELAYPGQQFWHGAYEQFGFYAESFHFDPDNTQSRYGFGWPPMNFDKFSYIITYGQKIQALSYNVWETIDVPVRTGAKVGHMILSPDFAPEKVYVYQIPKIRIENDVNNTKTD